MASGMHFVALDGIGLKEAVVAIRALSMQEFDRFGAGRVSLNGLTHKAIEWFADDAGIVLGAIAYHPVNLEWSYVIMGRDIYGKFGALDLDTGLCDLDVVRRLLLEKMTARVTAASKNALSQRRRVAVSS
jgi:hypothetical protein